MRLVPAAWIERCNCLFARLDWQDAKRLFHHEGLARSYQAEPRAEGGAPQWICFEDTKVGGKKKPHRPLPLLASCLFKGTLLLWKKVLFENDITGPCSVEQIIFPLNKVCCFKLSFHGFCFLPKSSCSSATIDRLLIADIYSPVILMPRESWTSGDWTLTTNSSTWLPESCQWRRFAREPDRYKSHMILWVCSFVSTENGHLHINPAGVFSPNCSTIATPGQQTGPGRVGACLWPALPPWETGCCFTLTGTKAKPLNWWNPSKKSHVLWEWLWRILACESHA